ncbi:dioxygenase family protein [Paenibacillus sp. y28]|uniref:dioxygenase family protein n=1 Tax=Paenibacillus sp. y28 TaxID=3129110 RepID=UPI003018CBFB
MMPAYFFAHGAPSLILDHMEYTNFLKEFAADKPKPKAIVLFSAHWENPEQAVSGVKGTYETIYDFYGFPDALYQMTYPAPGNPELGSEIQSVLAAHGIANVLDEKRGLDHGAWGILKLLYPDAAIPVVALSVNRYLTGEEQYNIGKAIGALREKDVLVIGSGGTVHNLRRVSRGAQQPEAWAVAFDDWLKENLEAWDTEALFRYAEDAPYGREAVPTAEHFVPLLLAMGAGDAGRQAKLLHRTYQYGTLSLSCWEFK